MISWTDPSGLDAVTARFGPRAARYIPAHGPIVLAHMIGMGEPFRSANIIQLLRKNEYPTFSERECMNIVMQVIRYINYSNADYYVQQQRVRKTYLWFLFNPGNGKAQLQQADALHAAKSRVYIERVLHQQSRENVIASGKLPTQPIPREPRLVQRIQPIHLKYLKDAFAKYLKNMSMPLSAISPDNMATMFYTPAFQELLTIDQRDELTEFDEYALCDGFMLVSDMLADDARGGNASLVGDDGSLGLL